MEELGAEGKHSTNPLLNAIVDTNWDISNMNFPPMKNYKELDVVTYGSWTQVVTTI